MKLELDRLDLKRKEKGIACSRISFEHLSEKAQEAVRAVGKATFWEFDRRCYNVVYPPAEGKT